MRGDVAIAEAGQRLARIQPGLAILIWADRLKIRALSGAEITSVALLASLLHYRPFRCTRGDCCIDPRQASARTDQWQSDCHSARKMWSIHYLTTTACVFNVESFCALYPKVVDCSLANVAWVNARLRHAFLK